MSLRAVELYHVSVPLKKAIRHASHWRTTSDNLVVCVKLENGQVGYGEGVPRPYVTGETIESALQTIASFDWARHMAAPGDFLSVVKRLEALTLSETAPG